jgi:hypothetical protein
MAHHPMPDERDHSKPPHPADIGIRINRCLGCLCETRNEAWRCLARRGTEEKP